MIRPGAIGDFVVSLPAMECLTTTGYCEVWAPARAVPLVRFAARVRAISATGLDLLGVTEPPARLIDELRSFDSIVSWYGANRPDFCELLAGINPNCRFFRALPPEGTTVHATDYYLKQVRSLAPCTSDGIPRISCETAREDFAVIHPFSGSPRKNWPLEEFRRMAHELERSMPVRWCAGPEDPPVENAVRIDDLYELARFLSRARLYIGNDSGVTHLAAAVGTPVVALFGPTDPRVWAPRGPQVRVVLWGEDPDVLSALQ